MATWYWGRQESLFQLSLVRLLGFTVLSLAAAQTQIRCNPGVRPLSGHPAIPAILLKWLKGAKLALWIQDLWPESLSATGFI
ncbi:hypothetical protein, partial [Pseudomonas piscis]|uniref:hypothetical protein n=1 Tax=Pseudomonas piscis TaxID=2614538 RepID=UPI001F3C23F5